MLNPYFCCNKDYGVQIKTLFLSLLNVDSILLNVIFIFKPTMERLSPVLVF